MEIDSFKPHQQGRGVCPRGNDLGIGRTRKGRRLPSGHFEVSLSHLLLAGTRCEVVEREEKRGIRTEVTEVRKVIG